MAACAGPAPENREKSPRGRAAPIEGDLGDSLLRLAEEALERGEFERAEGRFRRVLAATPRAPRALVGVGRIALARGELDAARAHFEAALAAAPESAAARLGLADLEERAGNPAAARHQLSAVLALDPARADVHARLAALTGPAPRRTSLDPSETLRMAAAHPYDPWALLRAGEALAAAGKAADAVALLEQVVWLADLDPPSAEAAVQRLRDLSEPWRKRRVVRVHVFADEFVRAQEAWRFRLRALWAAASGLLSEILEIQFVPVSVDPFRSAEAAAGLESIHDAVARSAWPPPKRGIIAGFTGRPLPRVRGIRKKGIASLLERRLTVRFGPGTQPTRTLAHEILHLFGAIHVSGEVESLMNPDGEAMVLDRLNYRIVRATSQRTFGSRGFDRHVLHRIDLHETIEAYVAALRVNLAFRSLGFAEVLEARRLSRVDAARRARRVRLMDPHLADVSTFVARMMLLEGRRVEAVVMLEAAAELYGIRTPRGAEALQQAELLRAALVRELGSP